MIHVFMVHVFMMHLSIMHVFMIDISMTYILYIHDVCIADACIYDAESFGHTDKRILGLGCEMQYIYSVVKKQIKRHGCIKGTFLWS